MAWEIVLLEYGEAISLAKSRYAEYRAEKKAERIKEDRR